VNRVTGWGRCPSKTAEEQVRLQMVPLFLLITRGHRECACFRLCLIRINGDRPKLLRKEPLKVILKYFLLTLHLA